VKAILFTEYGGPEVLRLREVDKPEPGNNDVLIKVHAASVNAMEWRPFTFSPLFIRLIAGLKEPRDKRCGVDVAGRVEGIGSGVTRFRVGDDVFGLARGAFAEYVCTQEHKLVSKPPGISFEAAAAVPLAALTALQAVRDHGGVTRGQRVLINGAGGGVGTYAVQMAKALGAEVTAVCSTANQEVLRSIGADHLIDYTRDDFTRHGRYDVVLGINGRASLIGYRRALTPGGRCVIAGGEIRQFVEVGLLGLPVSYFDRRRYRAMLTRPNIQDLQTLHAMLAEGTLVPVVDRRYPLEEVSTAVRYLMQGHARGKVVVTVAT
jgi:NADPH:quinone reductase-like Zn-dependent oxidoreductase